MGTCYNPRLVTGHTRPAPAVEVAVLLAELPLFAALSADARAAMAPSFTRRDYARDDVVFFEGEAPEWLHILVCGHVKLVKHADDGREVIVRLAMPADVIGGVSAFGRRSHPYTAQAMVPVTTLCVAGVDFAAIMRRHPPVAGQTMHDLVEQLVEAHETMKSLATERVERRIARELVKLVDRAGRPTAGGVEIGVPLARQDVADIAGTTVETAIRVLSRWRRAGVVTTVHGHLVVLDLPELRAMAEDGAGA
jgi:CRP/FNR family transcriptional regulator, nitrogen oxide reductase regulator